MTEPGEDRVAFAAAIRPEHSEIGGHAVEVARDTLAVLEAFRRSDEEAIAMLLDNLACPACAVASLAFTLLGFGEGAGLDMARVIASWQGQVRAVVLRKPS